MSTITTQIRDAMYDRIVAAMPRDFKTTRKLPFPTMQPDMLPALGVYVMRETKSPYGDANLGPPHYQVDAIISVMILDLAGKPENLEGGVDRKIDLIEETILRDPGFVNIREKGTDQIIIDSIPNISRQYLFPQQGETYYLEARLQFTFRFMCVYEPIIPDDLKVIHVTTFLNEPQRPIISGEIPDVIGEYELEQ